MLPPYRRFCATSVLYYTAAFPAMQAASSPSRKERKKRRDRVDLSAQLIAYQPFFSTQAISSMLYHSTSFRSFVLKPPALYQLLSAKYALKLDLVKE